MSEANGEAPNNSSGEDRQFVHFSFYKLDRGFRLLPAAEREAALGEFAAVVEEYGERFPIRAYRSWAPLCSERRWALTSRRRMPTCR
jgi:hypothetical protein